MVEKNHRLDSECENLSFRQALYDLPHAEVGILDEDGCIVAANPLWLDSGASGGPDHHKTPVLGTDYFDVCRASFEESDATSLIQQLKQIIVGLETNYLMEYAVVAGQREYACKLMAFSLRDNPNSLMLVHETNEQKRQNVANLRHLLCT